MEKVDHETRKVQEEYTNNKGKLKTRNITENYTEINTYFYHKNHLNSIVAITDNLGNILEEYEYDVF
jgi:phosphopantetheine adenylyltransferase